MLDAPCKMEQPKHAALQAHVQKLRVKDIRHFFSVMRKQRHILDADSLFPHYGITVGEFSTAYVVNMAQRGNGNAPSQSDIVSPAARKKKKKQTPS